MSTRLKNIIRQAVAPMVFQLMKQMRQMGSYGNLMIGEVETGKFYLRADANVSNTVTMVVFRNGIRQTRNVDYIIDPLNFRCIIPKKSQWSMTDTVIADAGL